MAAPDCAILWDLDRTLVDIHIDLASIQEWKARLRSEFAAFDISPALSPLLPGLEGALQDLCAIDSAAADELGRRVYGLLDEWEDAAAKSFHVHKALVAMFVALQSAGVPQAIVTNNGAPVARRALAECLSSERIARTVVVTRTFGRLAKPCGDPLLDATALLGLPLGESRVVMVGDSSADQLALQAIHPHTLSARWVRAQSGQLWWESREVVDAQALLAISRSA
jgi:FMN phosphatase YigB (HAD superfamily)